MENLKTAAEQLEVQLKLYKNVDFQVEKLAVALEDFLTASIKEKITDPVDFSAVPGDYYFTEGSLGQYVELENAYAKFKLEVTGGETEQTKELLDMIKGIQKSD